MDSERRASGNISKSRLTRPLPPSLLHPCCSLEARVNGAAADRIKCDRGRRQRNRHRAGAVAYFLALKNVVHGLGGLSFRGELPSHQARHSNILRPQLRIGISRPSGKWERESKEWEGMMMTKKGLTSPFRSTAELSGFAILKWEHLQRERVSAELLILRASKKLRQSVLTFIA